MEECTNSGSMLELLLRPAFSVRDGIVTEVNRGAAPYLICVGNKAESLICTGAEEYRSFTGGMLYLTLSLQGQPCGASVVERNGEHIFILEQEADNASLQSMALAAQELREPLAGMMTAADRLLPTLDTAANPSAQNHAAQMNRRMFQMLRIISNMSDALQYVQNPASRQENLDVSALFREVFSRAGVLAEQAGYSLEFNGLSERVYSLVDGEGLERAIYNLISNAMKFSPVGSKIGAQLVRNKNMLRFSITDEGCGIDHQIQSSLYARHLRTPSLEDPRHGLGLGMLLVRQVAAAHGGAVLIDHPNGIGTRVTMTLAIRQDKKPTVHSPIFRIDYAGERDHGLVELSDVLPAALYEAHKIN